MYRVGIVTLWGNFNYGNRLQNYAVERLVDKKSLEPVTLIVPTKTGLHERVKSSLSRIIKKEPSQMIARKKSFDAFNAEFMHGRQLTSNIVCDEYICGSDQIWNYTFSEFGPEMFLSFATNKPTASLAASFGVSSIPDDLVPVYRKYLNDIDYISVREDIGVELVKKLTGRDVQLLVDPTMALDRSEWDQFQSNKYCPDEPYVLTYFLGRRPADLDRRIKNELGNSCIISLNDLKYPELYAINPCEFVGLIANADYVLTDSFHGAAFSIIYNRKFIVFNRIANMESMSSRIQTLLNTFSLENNTNERLHTYSDCTSGGKTAEQTLLKERKKVEDYLSDFFSLLD